MKIDFQSVVKKLGDRIATLEIDSALAAAQVEALQKELAKHAEAERPALETAAE